MNRHPAEQFDTLLKIISSERFLKMEGLGNEIPFFICPFEPQYTNEMAALVRNLKHHLDRKGVPVLEIDLYDLMIEILQQRNLFDRLRQAEPTMDKKEFGDTLKSVLDPERHLIPAIAEKVHGQQFKVLFLTGVGTVFPYIRSHTVLNNLQSTMKDRPTVMFFPGEYKQSDETGASLALFGLSTNEDRYYRAFNIYHFHV